MTKESLRKQFEKIKNESTIALNDKSTPAHVRVLMTSLISLFEIMLIVFLEKKTRKNSSNSGLPPSKNNGPNGNRNTGSRERPHLSNEIENLKTTKTSETVTPTTCLKCDESLHAEDIVNSEERKKMDIFYEVVEHTVISEHIECANCGHVNKGIFPKGMDGKIQYGNSIKAMIIDFLCVQMMSLQRTSEHLQGIMGRLISQAIMLKYLYQFSESLENWEKSQIEKIIEEAAIHCDETSVRVNKLTFWAHSYSSNDITLKFVHEKRGIEAMEEINIIPRYVGTLIHDCWASYLSYNNVDHSLCGGHLLRELKFIEDSNKFLWATDMKNILKKYAKIIARRKKTKVLTTSEYDKLVIEYRKMLKKAIQEMPPFPLQEEGKRKIKHSDAENLWLRLNKYESSVLMFARIKEVDFTNNRAERDLRMSKVKQKVSGGFRTIEMAKAFFRISSYLKSMRYRGYSSLEAISLALSGNIPS
jgi:hypothetical protein